MKMVKGHSHCLWPFKAPQKLTSIVAFQSPQNTPNTTLSTNAMYDQTSPLRPLLILDNLLLVTAEQAD